MTYASHVLNHSRKLTLGSKVLRHEHGKFVRCFSRSAYQFVERGNDTVWIGEHGLLGREGEIASDSSAGWNSGKGNFQHYENQSKIAVAELNVALSKKVLISFRDLPLHQEIGMPSLSPTMSEGNIARWLKKEGDKVYPGEVLCEVETDKATVEMECMEEGYLAKIICGDGSQGIKVGEIIAITVEEEEDVAKLKDYTPSEKGAAEPSPEPKKAPEPAPPKKEAVEERPPQPEPKVSKPSQTPSEDRIFASPLARKLAEDNSVSLSSIKGTDPDGRIVKADIEDYLASGEKEAPATATGAALDYTDITHTQIRKITASRLLMSKQTIPHYYLTVDACVDKLLELRGQLNALQEASGGKRISVLMILSSRLLLWLFEKFLHAIAHGQITIYASTIM